METNDDQLVCYCFHVPLRKIESFCRNQKPRYPSQISECLSAGTGCGWCVPRLKRIHQQICGEHQAWWREDTQDTAQELTSADEYETAEEYAAARKAYIERKNKAACHIKDHQ